MMNGIGKFLVLCQTVLSVLFMTWAAMVYFQYTDYGWKEPLKIWETKDSGYRVAGLLDKRTGHSARDVSPEGTRTAGRRARHSNAQRLHAIFPKNH